MMVYNSAAATESSRHPVRRPRLCVPQTQIEYQFGRYNMSSVATWGREDILTVDAAPNPVPLAEAALDYRLKSLKEVARALLQEIEALSTSQPQDPSQNVRLHDEVQRFESSLICHALGRTGG